MSVDPYNPLFDIKLRVYIHLAFSSPIFAMTMGFGMLRMNFNDK